MNEEGSSPVREMLVIVKEEVPALVSVTAWAALVVPRAVEGKVSAAVLRVTESVAVPVPLSATVCGEPGAVSATLRVALRAAAEAGLKATKTAQLAPAASEVPQVFNWRNDVGLVPAIDIELSVTAPEPLFVTVTSCAALVAPNTVLGNVRVVGDSVIDRVAAAAPVPVSVTFWGEPVALSAMLSVAVNVPVVTGLKLTETVHDAPAARVAPQVVVLM